MALADASSRGQRFAVAKIKSGGAGREISASATAFDQAISLQIEAKLDTTRMKAGGPIKFPFRQKVMPLDAVANAPKTAKQRLPPRTDITPRRAFRERGVPSRDRFARRSFAGNVFWIGTHVQCGSAGNGNDSQSGICIWQVVKQNAAATSLENISRVH